MSEPYGEAGAGVQRAAAVRMMVRAAAEIFMVPAAEALCRSQWQIYPLLLKTECIREVMKHPFPHSALLLISDFRQLADFLWS